MTFTDKELIILAQEILNHVSTCAVTEWNDTCDGGGVVYQGGGAVNGPCFTEGQDSLECHMPLGACVDQTKNFYLACQSSSDCVANIQNDGGALGTSCCLYASPSVDTSSCPGTLDPQGAYTFCNSACTQGQFCKTDAECSDGKTCKPVTVTASGFDILKNVNFGVCE